MCERISNFFLSIKNTKKKRKNKKQPKKVFRLKPKIKAEKYEKKLETTTLKIMYKGIFFQKASFGSKTSVSKNPGRKVV